MKTHYKLNSKQNVIRQAFLDYAQNDETTLKGLVDWQLEQGTSLKRLTIFGARRLRANPTAVMIALLILTNQMH